MRSVYLIISLATLARLQEVAITTTESVSVVPAEAIISNFSNDESSGQDKFVDEESQKSKQIANLEKQRVKLLKYAAYPQVSLNSSFYQGGCNLTCAQDCFASTLTPMATFLECLLPLCKCAQLVDKPKTK
jgi:hypothetical protein